MKNETMETLGGSPANDRGGLNAVQVDLVQNSFQRVQPISDAAARLFELDPSLRPMFRGDLEEQGRKLMQTLAFAVASLNRMEEIVPAVENLGRRHASYGVQDAHYATVADALLWTLHRGLGPAFTPEVAEAWTALYGVVSAAMKRGAGSMQAAA